MAFLGLQEKRFGGLRFIRHRKSFDYKSDAKRRAKELRSQDKLVRMIKEDGEWWLYSRRK